MVFLKEVIDFDEVAQDLSLDLSAMPQEQIFQQFQEWFWHIQDSEYWFESESLALDHVEYLKEKFLEEYYIFPFKVASQLNLEVVEA